MHQTSPPSEVDASTRTASEVSQWLYLHTALGKGYVAPFAYTPAWVISSGVPVELTYRMREAENTFHAFHEESVASDKANLDRLEQLAQATKRVGTDPKVLAQIKSLKERLARPVFVNYRDWNADRATMLELLSKSKFRSMSFVDELGIRSHNYTVNKFLANKYISADLSLLSLTGDQSSDSVLIRSSSTGGANMLSVRGADTPRFNLMTLTSPSAIHKIHGRLREAVPCYGITVLLDVVPSETLQVPSDQIARVIRKVYATEDPNDRVVVDASPGWSEFLSMSPKDAAASGAAMGAMHKSLTSVQTLVKTITRAVITRKFFLVENDIAESGDRTLMLDAADLELAQQWFRDLAPKAFGVTHLSTRRKNAEVARAAWMSGPSVESCVAAKQQLIKLIREDEHQMVAAGSTGLAPRTLDAVLEANTNVFLVENKRRPGAKRAAARMITLHPEWEQAPVGGEDTGHPGDAHSDEVKDTLYRKWQKEAQRNMQGGGRPSVALDYLPEAMRSAAIGVQQRFWQTTTFAPSGEGGSTELWFRHSADGSDMCVWEESFREWKLREKWQDKDED